MKLFGKILENHCKRAAARVSAWFADTKAKLKNLFKKKKEDEESEEAETENTKPEDMLSKDKEGWNDETIENQE